MNTLIIIFNTFRTELPSKIKQNKKQNQREGGREELRRDGEKEGGREELRGREEGREGEQEKGGEDRRENFSTFWSLLTPSKPSPRENVCPR